MKKKDPMVSIVIPTYNRAGEIEKAVKSLLALAYPNYEIIVVDDASSDNTPAILDKFKNKIRVVQRKQNGGPGSARNDGIKAAKGKFIAFTDSDCTISKQWLDTLVKFIQSTPKSTAGVCGRIYPPKGANFLVNLIYFMPQMDGNSLLSERIGKPFSVNNVSCNNALWKKDVLTKMRYFDESFFKKFKTVPEDSELCYRTVNKGYKFYMYPGAPVYHHFRPTLKKFLEQSYRAGRGGGIVMMKHSNWFGKKTIFVYLLPLFLVASLLYPPLLLFPIFFSIPSTFSAFRKSKKIEYLLFTPVLWLIKTYINMIGIWKGIFDSRAKK